MTEGLITSLFKQGTMPKHTELQSQEREGEIIKLAKYRKLILALITHEPTVQ